MIIDTIRPTTRYTVAIIIINSSRDSTTTCVSTGISTTTTAAFVDDYPRTTVAKIWQCCSINDPIPLRIETPIEIKRIDTVHQKIKPTKYLMRKPWINLKQPIAKSGFKRGQRKECE